MKIILASKSPRRKELLAGIVSNFEIVTSNVDEKINETDPKRYVIALAQRKAFAVAKKNKDSLVIGADTVVYCDNKFWNKPKDKEDARYILQSLSDKQHCVYSGVCVILNDTILTDYCVSKVKFKKLSENFIEEYIDSGIPMDKAGAYGIQQDISPVESYEGDFTNIVGLPVDLTRKMIKNIISI